MAAPASKNLSSCSPVPSKPTNPRYSEASNPMRRSFSGNPFAKPSITAGQRPGFNNPNTPANSPSDYPRRNSIGRENMFVSYPEDKENGNQNSKQSKVRSPASSKGARNFMSPTISAASKINASPRKKILTERNESIRSSISFSDGKGPLKDDSDTKPEQCLNQKKEVSFDPVITYLEDKDEVNSNADFDSMVQLSTTTDDLDSFSESVTLGNDCVNLDPSFSISPRTSCSLPIPALAPLDADPSLSPYDPKTNYLSPRPQFLHYKPNPRIELYLNKEREGMQLEEIFASESSSSGEVTEEETQSDDSPKESECSSSNEMGKEVVEKEKEEEEEELLLSEPKHINTSEGAVTAKRVSKPNFFTRTKFTALLFVLAIACLWASVSNSPVMDPSVLNNLSLSNPYIPPQISEFARKNLEGLAQKFRQWLYESLSYIHNMIISFREQHKQGPIQFANLSILLEDGLVDNSFPLVAQSTFKYESVDLERRKEPEIDSDQNIEVFDVESIEKEEDQPSEADTNAEDTDVADQEVVAGDKKDHEFEDKEVIVAHDYFQVPVSEFEVVNGNPQAEVNQPGNLAREEAKEIVETADYICELQSNTDVIIDQPVLIPKAADIKPEVSDSRHFLAETDVVSTEIESIVEENKLESIDSVAEMKSQRAESVDLTLDGNKNLFSAQTVMGISLLALSLLAAVTFIHVKNRTSTAPKAATAVNKMRPTEKLDHSPLLMPTGHTFQERQPSSRNWQTEVETIGESCPSEMSSFQYSSSSSYYSKQGQKGLTSEAQSQERKPKRSTRRESMASSDCSLGSPSYGSFTTYEKITNKHVNGEEEWLTPVRRSSRIRNHVTSP